MNKNTTLNDIISSLMIETNQYAYQKLFTAFVEKTQRKMINFLSKDFSKLSIEQSEEITQETYLNFNKLLSKQKQQRQTQLLDKNGRAIDKIFDYLYHIAKNEALRQLKKTKETETLNQNEEITTETLVEDENYMLDLRSRCLAISAIAPHTQRDAFHLSVQRKIKEEKFTDKDIAKMIGAKSANAVMQRRKEATKKYRQLIKIYQNRITETEKIPLEHIKRNIQKKLKSYSILQTLETKSTEEINEIELLVWQIILFTSKNSFEKHCKFFLLDEVSEPSKQQKNDFSDLNYIYLHWIKHHSDYQFLFQEIKKYK